jgi:predicted ATPase
MRIKKLKFSDQNFDFDEIEFTETLNLLVGASGSGKTKLLTAIFAIGSMVSGTRNLSGEWSISYSHRGNDFTWHYKAGTTDGQKVQILEEQLWLDNDPGNPKQIIERNGQVIRFQGERMPKMARDISALRILREEEIVDSAVKGFGLIMRRNFSGEDLADAMKLTAYPYELMAKLSDKKRRNSVRDLYAVGMSLHARLYLLHEFFPKLFQDISTQFRLVFPTCEQLIVASAAKHLPMPSSLNAPLVLIREKDVATQASIHDISSGMQKVLLIITDIVSGPAEMLYLIDEYENSLGVNAIDFLPGFLLEYGKRRQFMLTSHHPMLINSMPVKDWFVFTRRGRHVTVKFGNELARRYEGTKQDRFIQLLNDPDYTGAAA